MNGDTIRKKLSDFRHRCLDFCNGGRNLALMKNQDSPRHRDPKGKRSIYGRPTYNQAYKIIQKFGGETRFAFAVGVSRIQAYRMGYARPAGTDGLVPGTLVDDIIRAARREGIFLTDEDWRPERINYEAMEDENG